MVISKSTLTDMLSHRDGRTQLKRKELDGRFESIAKADVGIGIRPKGFHGSRSRGWKTGESTERKGRFNIDMREEEER